eukprot:s96_g6.t3
MKVSSSSPLHTFTTSAASRNFSSTSTLTTPMAFGVTVATTGRVQSPAPGSRTMTTTTTSLIVEAVLGLSETGEDLPEMGTVANYPGPAPNMAMDFTRQLSTSHGPIQAYAAAPPVDLALPDSGGRDHSFFVVVLLILMPFLACLCGACVKHGWLFVPKPTKVSQVSRGGARWSPRWHRSNCASSCAMIPVRPLLVINNVLETMEGFGQPYCLPGLSRSKHIRQNTEPSNAAVEIGGGAVLRPGGVSTDLQELRFALSTTEKGLRLRGDSTRGAWDVLHRLVPLVDAWGMRRKQKPLTAASTAMVGRFFLLGRCFVRSLGTRCRAP